MFNKKLSFLILPLFSSLTLQANDPFMQDPFGDDIFKEMMQMQQEMDKMFTRMHQRIEQRSSGMVTPLGAYKLARDAQFIDKGDYYEFETSIPQNKENKIDITVKNGLLSISAKIVEKNEKKSANGYSSSSSVRMYQQSISIPIDSNESSVKADYHNDHLVISIDKKASTPVNTIKVEHKKDENSTKNVVDENQTKQHKQPIHSDMSSMS